MNPFETEMCLNVNVFKQHGALWMQDWCIVGFVN